MRRIASLALLALLTTATASQAVIMKLTPLAEVLESEQFIFVAAVDKTDPEKPSAIFKFEKNLKGEAPFDRIPVNMTGDDEAKKAGDTKTDSRSPRRHAEGRVLRQQTREEVQRDGVRRGLVVLRARHARRRRQNGALGVSARRAVPAPHIQGDERGDGEGDRGRAGEEGQAARGGREGEAGIRAGCFEGRERHRKEESRSRRKSRSKNERTSPFSYSYSYSCLLCCAAIKSCSVRRDSLLRSGRSARGHCGTVPRCVRANGYRYEAVARIPRRRQRQ